jgi:4'-phosphopantetheinyl transferase
MQAKPPIRVVVLPTPDQEPDRPPRERVRAQSRGARDALRAAAARAGCAEPLAFEKDPRGAPRPAGGWCWSLSHDATWVAAAVHDEPVGVDLERVDLRRPELVARVLCDAERALLGALDALTFTRLWTAKEAVLKAAGVGMAELSSCLLVEPPAVRTLVLEHRGLRCVVRQAYLRGHVLAVHAPGAGWEVDWLLPRSIRAEGLPAPA